mgnify:CR=1 FL=1
MISWRTERVSRTGFSVTPARKLQIFAEQFGVPAFGSVDELLATARPQVVSVATPPDSVPAAWR